VIRKLASLASVVGFALAGVVAATPAYASLATISCTGWTHATYAPGLTNTAKSTAVVVDGDLTQIRE
jgi:hypothetical protein